MGKNGKLWVSHIFCTCYDQEPEMELVNHNGLNIDLIGYFMKLGLQIQELQYPERPTFTE